jgi:hypothetical protein
VTALANLRAHNKKSGRCSMQRPDYFLTTDDGCDYLVAATGASVAMSTFTPGPIVDEIETRLM